VKSTNPGAEVSEVADPLLVRASRDEVALQQVAGLLDRGLVGDCRPALAAAQLALDLVLAHDAGDLVAADLDIRRRSSSQVLRAP
jgi:hypothetical protein